ncbi:MAG TPA: tetratricopeptide repeat protein [Kiloniellaceae bacterium]|nr:tetratricopeptide repeat protein [Kiloniellaceae bacterium]
MRQIAIALLFLCAVAAGHLQPALPAAADQNDARLDDLFVQLKGTEDFEHARRVEISIWRIWTASNDDAVNTLMVEGTTAMTDRDLHRALRYFDQVVAIAPDFAEGWNKRATIYYLLGDYEASLADIEKTLEREPRHFGALAGRGLVLISLNRPQEALEAYEEALAIHPHLIGALQNAEILRKILKDQQI